MKSFEKSRPIMISINPSNHSKSYIPVSVTALTGSQSQHRISTHRRSTQPWLSTQYIKRSFTNYPSTRSVHLAAHWSAKWLIWPATRPASGPSNRKPTCQRQSPENTAVHNNRDFFYFFKIFLKYFKDNISFTLFLIVTPFGHVAPWVDLLW